MDFRIEAEAAHLEHYEADYLRTTSAAPIKYERNMGPVQMHAADLVTSSLVISQTGSTFFAATYLTTTKSLAISLQTNGTSPIYSNTSEVIASDPKAIKAGNSQKPYEFSYDYSRPHLTVNPQDGTVQVVGDYTLWIWDALVNAQSHQGSSSYVTGAFYSNDTGVTHDVKYQWLVISLHNATLSLKTGEPNVALYADQVQTTHQGAVQAIHAEGRFQAGDEAYSAHDENATLEGNLHLELAPVVSGPQGVLSSQAPRIRVDIQGDLASTNLYGVATHAGAAPLFPVSLLQVVIPTSLAVLMVCGVFVYARPRLPPGYLSGLLLGLVRQRNSRPGGVSPGLERRALGWHKRDIPLVSSFFALRCWRRILADGTPPMDRPGYVHMQAQCLLGLGRWNAAIRELSLLKALFPRREDVRYDLARAYALRSLIAVRHRGRWRELALKELAGSVRLDPRKGERAQADRAFLSLRRTPGFTEIVSVNRATLQPGTR